MHINARYKDEWLKRLRSGDIPQTQKALRERDGLGRCCLGVLCDVVMDVDRIGEWAGPMFISEGESEYDDEYEGVFASEGELHHLMLDRVGLTNDEQQTLIGMNDDEEDPSTFYDIADYIELHN